MPDLRYVACRMCEMISGMDPGDLQQGMGVVFSKTLLKRWVFKESITSSGGHVYSDGCRLQQWHAKCYDKKVFSDQEKYLFACYSGFFAEVFAKIRLVSFCVVIWGHPSARSGFLLQDNKPMAVMNPFIFKYVQFLLELKEDYFIREACNILKVGSQS